MSITHFYLLKDDTAEAYTRSVCHLVNQLYLQQLTSYLYCESVEIAEQFDDSLWTFRDIYFIPHGLITHQSPQTTGPFCTIGFPNAMSSPPPGTVLFNLTDTVPEFFMQYGQVLEVVLANEKARVASRKRYKQYQQAGYQIKTENYQS